MKQPFFSIITVSYNAGKEISKTIESVLEQYFTDYEIIIKDACSTDDTVSFIPDNERIKLIVTPDNGIYYGMNEAVNYANGKYLLFLNCGDILSNKDVLSSFYSIAKNHNESNSIIYGDYKRKGIISKQKSKITPFYLFRTPLCHQTVFFGGQVIKKLKGYDTSYNILADYDLTLKAYNNSVNFIYHNKVVCEYLGGGVSETKKGIEIKNKEYVNIRKKYYSKTRIFIYNMIIFFSMKGLRQKIVSDSSPVWLRKLYGKMLKVINK